MKTINKDCPGNRTQVNAFRPFILIQCAIVNDISIFNYLPRSLEIKWTTVTMAGSMSSKRPNNTKIKNRTHWKEEKRDNENNTKSKNKKENNFAIYNHYMEWRFLVYDTYAWLLICVVLQVLALVLGFIRKQQTEFRLASVRNNGFTATRPFEIFGIHAIDVSTIYIWWYKVWLICVHWYQVQNSKRCLFIIKIAFICFASKLSPISAPALSIYDQISKYRINATAHNCMVSAVN